MKETKHRTDPPYFGFPKPLLTEELCIDDQELFSSLVLNGALGKLKEAVELKDYDSALAEWQSYITSRTDAPLPEHYLTLPMSNKQIVKEAELIVNHKIIGWGVHRTSFSKKIDFVGFASDHRLEEFHHLTFLTYLADGYSFENLPKFAVEYEVILKQWFAQHEKVHTTSTAHPIWNPSGCGIRTIAIIDSYNRLKKHGGLSSELHKIVLEIVLASARWLYRAQEQYYPGSAGFDACAALVLAGTYFHEFKESGDWVKRGIECVKTKIDREYSEEGVYTEMSDAYGLNVLDRLVYIFEIMKLQNGPRLLPADFSKKLAAFAEYFAHTCTPLGTTNSFNDSAYIQLDDRLIHWAGLFRRWDLAYTIRDRLPPELKRKSRSPSRGPSLDFPKSGRAIMRTGWNSSDLYMAIEYSAGDAHSHYETTNFTIYAFGRPMIIDRGKGTTYDDPYHLFLRSSRLHSMVTLGDMNIDLEQKGAKTTVWHSGECFDCIVLEHNGYKKKYGAVIARSIVFVKPHYWIISDAVLAPKKTVKAISYLHTFPILVVREDGNFECKQPPGFVLAIPHDKKEEFLKERAVANLAHLDTEIQWTDWIGFKKSAKQKDGTTFMNVIYPYEKRSPDVEITRINAMPLRGSRPVARTAAEAFEVRTPDGTDIFFISHGKPMKRRYGPVISDAQLGLLRLDKGAIPTSHMLVDATTLEYNRKSLCKTKKPVPFTEKTYKPTRKST